MDTQKVNKREPRRPNDQHTAELASRITYDTKPKRRLFEALKAQGMAANQQVTFLTDGGEDIRDLPCYLNPDIGNHRNQILLNARVARRGASAVTTAPSRSGPGTAW